MTKKNIWRRVTFLTAGVLVLYCAADMVSIGIGGPRDLPEMRSWALAASLCAGIMALAALYFYKPRNTPEITSYVPTSCYLKHLRARQPGGGDQTTMDGIGRPRRAHSAATERTFAD